MWPNFVFVTKLHFSSSMEDPHRILGRNLHWKCFTSASWSILQSKIHHHTILNIPLCSLTARRALTYMLKHTKASLATFLSGLKFILESRWIVHRTEEARGRIQVSSVRCKVFAAQIKSEVVYNWTIEHEFELPAPSQRVPTDKCTPSSTFALLTAIEIQRARASGTYQGLSKQEVVDCYGDSCFAFSAERTRKVAEWLERRGRLAPEDKYAEYKGDRKACKSNPAPNALHNWSIKGVRRITPDQFEDAIKE
eukprot:sb/3468701/